MKNFFFFILLIIESLGTSAVFAQNPGFGFVWVNGTTAKDEVLSRPYIKFGQAEFIWKEIEPTEGNFNWTEMDNVLKKYYDLGKCVPIQINTPVPEWIFNYVACVGTSRKGNAPQYWDPIYLGYLEKMIKAYADHLGNSPYKKAVLSVRMQLNALNTEITNFDSHYLGGTASPDRNKWTYPKNGHIHAPDLNPQLEGELIQKITEMYIKHFYPYNIPVTLRLPAEASLTKLGFDGTKIFDKWCENPLTRLLTTHYSIGLMASKEANIFKRRCRQLGTQAFMEQFGQIGVGGKSTMTAEDLLRMRQITYLNSGKRTVKELSQEQATYWTMLMLLDWGASYISLYGKDLQWVDSFPPVISTFNFINRYAGYQANPANSPGAWRVFGEFFPRMASQPSENNMGWFVKEESLANTEAVNFAVDNEDILGVFARRFKAPVKFNLDTDFANSLAGTINIKVIYYPKANEKISILGAKSKGIKKYFGEWIEESFAIPAQSLKSGFTIVPSGQPIVHLLEVKSNKQVRNSQ